MMTRERFEQLTSAYGADPKRWPAAERQLMEAYLRQFPTDAEELLSSESALDAWLSQARAPRASAELESRVLAAAPRPERRPGIGSVWIATSGGVLSFGRGAVFAALVLAAGISIGYAGGSAAVDAAAGEAFISQAYLDAETALSLEG